MTTNATKKPAKASVAKVAPALDPKKLLADEPAILKAIESIGNRGANLQKDIHIVACSTLQHLARHSDVRIIDKMVTGLIKAIPAFGRVNALKQWFETFGMVTFVEGVATFDRTKGTKLEEALKKPFWTLKGMEGVAYVPLVADTYVDQQIKRLEKDQTEGKHTNFASLIVNLKDYKATLAKAA